MVIHNWRVKMESTRQPIMVGSRKAISSSAIEKIKKKKKKKRRSKDGKSSSSSSNSAPDKSRSREQDGYPKARSATSCPPSLLGHNPGNPSADETPRLNESLRWLSLIANQSRLFPGGAGANDAKLTDSVKRMSEAPEDEEERLQVYKMNRRKRYLAAQQTLLDLYPDPPAPSGKDKPGLRGAFSKTTNFYAPSSLVTKAAPVPSSSGGVSDAKFELAVPSAIASDAGAAQKVL